MAWTALSLIALGALWRLLPVWAPALGNFSPLMALAFCGGAYFKDRRLWLAPFAALALSDAYLDHYYAAEFHYHWSLGGAVVRFACFAAALGLGRLVSRRRSWPALAAGALGSSLLFYLVTNTVSWAGDAGYPAGLAGWIQAMTVGHPEFPSTFSFFRNTLASDLLFTALFAGACEWAARLRGEPNLLGRGAERRLGRRAG
jgi:Family of unknown function (DUF6580)